TSPPATPTGPTTSTPPLTATAAGPDAPTATATAVPPSPTPTATESPTATQVPSPTPTAIACVGDCNGDGVVTINELILAVNIALGLEPISACPAIDANHSREVTIEELIRPIANAQNGCPWARSAIRGRSAEFRFLEGGAPSPPVSGWGEATGNDLSHPAPPGADGAAPSRRTANQRRSGS